MDVEIPPAYLDIARSEVGPAPDPGRVGRLRGAAALLALRRRARSAGVLILDDDEAKDSGAGEPVVVVHDPVALRDRLGSDVRCGLADAFVAGEWSSPDPAAVLAALDPLESGTVQRVGGVLTAPGRVSGGRRRRERVVGDDAPLDLVSTFTDETLSTAPALFASSARTRVPVGDGTDVENFEPPMPPPTRSSLADAQRRRMDEMLSLAGVGAGKRLLLVGADRGEIAVVAAARGAEVTVLAHGFEEFDTVCQRLDEAGLGDVVHVRTGASEEVDGDFDAALVFERAELAGRERIGEVLADVDRRLRPGGRALLLAVIEGHAGMGWSELTLGWTRRRVWPTFRPPRPRELRRVVARAPGLRVRRRLFLGAHAAETYRLWAEIFISRRREAAALGYTPSARRLWRFHLAVLEAAMRTGRLEVELTVLSKN